MNERLSEIFEKVCAISANQRAAYLQQACGGDAKLRAAVEAMLEEQEGRLASDPHGESAGDVIDRYQLVKEIGEGGMGTVWMAQQSEPVTRKVALKVIKLGMDTKEVVARFEAERQALALMDHPHIAKVLDGGATKNGRPFFVMELVDGIPITEYCDEHKLDVRDRLGLFSMVCEAIQHAHHKGIIHRDIKPSNVMVAIHDGVPVPKVIDFGIAKATSAELTQKTLLTQNAQIIGTPDYMAPEQAALSGLDIDTRVDVYSLGVLLYELLSGAKPFDVRELLATGYGELLRTIREVDPAKPSTRVSSLGECATTVALNRQVNVDSLGKHLRGDLDWIVMRAIEKDRARRYETPSAFAADVNRFLNDETVEAHPPSGLYRLRKFVHRRKSTVIAGVTILILLVGGSIGTGVGWWKTTKANTAMNQALDQKDEALLKEERQRILAQENEQRAKDAEAEARSETERATKAEGEANDRAQELEQVAAFQAEQLSGIDPSRMGALLRQSLVDAAPEERRDALSESLKGINFTNLALGTLQENIFGRTIEAIDLQFADQPLVQAQLLRTIAETLSALGLVGSAVDPMQRALVIRRRELGEDHPGTIAAVSTMGALLHAQGEYAEADHYYRLALDGCRRILGEEHEDTLACIHNMGTLRRLQGLYEESEKYYREVIEKRRRVLGSDHLKTQNSMNQLAIVLRVLGEFEEAESICREVIETRRRTLGDDDLSTVSALSNMGMLLRTQGRSDEAEPFLQEALDCYRRILGDEHPETLTAINNMGLLCESQGKLVEAEKYYREDMETSLRILGDEHPGTMFAFNNLGALLYSQGKFSEAEVYFRRALDVRQRVLGNEHPETLSSFCNLGVLQYRQGRIAEAAFFLGRGVELARRVLGEDHPDTLRWINSLETVLRELVQEKRKEATDDSGALPALARALEDCGAHLLLLGKFSEAETMISEAWERIEGQSAELAVAEDVLQSMIELYDAWHVAEPAGSYSAKAEAWRTKQAAWQAKGLQELDD